MGCDIHSYLEVQDTYGNWCSVDVWKTELETYKDSNGSVEIYGYIHTDMHKRDGRDYELFGFLSEGVRRECDDPLPVLDWPDDLSHQVAYTYSRWEGDAHSENWVMLSDLREHYAKMALLKQNPTNDWLIKSIKHLIDDIDKTLDKRFVGGANDVPDEAVRLVYWFDN